MAFFSEAQRIALDDPPAPAGRPLPQRPIVLEASATPEGVVCTITDAPSSRRRWTWKPSLEKFCSHMSKRPHPFLESLTLAIPEQEDNKDLTILEFSSPPGVNKVNLKHLSLIKTTRVGTFRRILHAPLTSLTIRDSIVWYSWAEVLIGLSNLPSLEVLVLDNLMLEYKEIDPREGYLPFELSTTGVQLPYLKTFEFWDSTIVGASVVLDRLIFPSDVILTVSFGNEYWEHSKPADWERNAEIYTSNIPDSVYRLLQYRAFHITPLIRYDGTVLNGYTFTAGDLDDRPFSGSEHRNLPRPPPSYRRTIVEDADVEDDANAEVDADQHADTDGKDNVLVREHLWPLLECYVFGVTSSATELVVTHPRFLSPKLWIALSRRFSVAQDLTAEGPAGLGLLQALRADRLLFPRLTRIRLREVDMVSVLPDGQSVLDTLIDILDNRGDGPLSLLQFDNCNVMSLLMHTLKRHPSAHKIEWDGKSILKEEQAPDGRSEMLEKKLEEVGWCRTQ
ncbi:hypothetical protein BV25DRAFT_1726316 [Artomyces pyxidatus]|uniref:Uncharacterized protein n=1 Tax=Artomyces pyxidatus TaxID=48021 RepID=A0ACB8SI61_9AGAM|nr:hypothetical protein BV25DRAFT_1726316 [Artomyces pyxidatus]